jgi:CRP/FNR family nitrogen fixation transcriptional regulator
MHTQHSRFQSGARSYVEVPAEQNALEALDSIAIVTKWRRDQEICGQESSPDHWYRVLSGAARKFVIRANGQRHIVDLLMPNDFFGFASGERHACSVQAISDGTTTACYPRKRIEALADADPAVARMIRGKAFEAIGRLQQQLVVVGHTKAIEKVGALLVKLLERQADKRTDDVALPMSRYDMADYLGISVETVSRSITDLKQVGLIALRGTRNVRIVDRMGLEDGEAD